MVLDDVTELYEISNFSLLYPIMIFLIVYLNSDYTGAQTKLAKILLNGNNICMVS